MWRLKAGNYDPAAAVKRGYTLTFDAEGHLVRSVSAIRPGDQISTTFADGRLTSTVNGSTVASNE